jgi:myo-inositol-1(or 4)-monophosphatase
MTDGERSAIEATAIDAAVAAAEIQRARLVDGARIEDKGAADITTDVDSACEAAITAIIRARHPDHGLLAEEGTAAESASGLLWIIDPLDGTKNFAHRYPRSCVSIALARDGELELGVVLNPHSGELFVAHRGGGATRNGEAIRVSPVAAIDRAMVASALTYDGRSADRAQLERLARVLGAAQAVRSDGCAALDLCDVACGRFDAYFERGLKPWDTAAGSLIVREAGGRVTTFTDGAHDLYGLETAASNGLIHQALLGLL